jgi:hypothetical protein
MGCSNTSDQHGAAPSAFGAVQRGLQHSGGGCGWPSTAAAGVVPQPIRMIMCMLTLLGRQLSFVFAVGDHGEHSGHWRSAVAVRAQLVGGSPESRGPPICQRPARSDQLAEHRRQFDSRHRLRTAGLAVGRAPVERLQPCQCIGSGRRALSRDHSLHWRAANPSSGARQTAPPCRGSSLQLSCALG